MPSPRTMLAAALALAAAAPAADPGEGDSGAAARFGSLLEAEWKDRPEWGDMAVAILKGEAMNTEKGWWRPSARRLGWEWLAKRFDADGDGRIVRAELPGAERCFEPLDRDLDGGITRGDLEGARGGPRSPLAGRLFGKLDADSNGRIGREELLGFFQRADRGGLGFLTPEDLRLAFAEPAERRTAGGGGGEGPSPWEMLSLLMSGQIGTLDEGPRVGDPAPDFELPTVDGKDRRRLSDSWGRRPAVLIFGSFT